MTAVLQRLIHDARTQLGSASCRAGRHTWGFEGGRSCPHDLDDNCSQAVYVCIVCGTNDYGGHGGPGDRDCAQHCRHKPERAAAIAARTLDPLGHIWNTHPRVNHFLLLRALRRQPKPHLP